MKLYISFSFRASAKSSSLLIASFFFLIASSASAGLPVLGLCVRSSFGSMQPSPSPDPAQFLVSDIIEHVFYFIK